MHSQQIQWHIKKKNPSQPITKDLLLKLFYFPPSACGYSTLSTIEIPNMFDFNFQCARYGKGWKLINRITNSNRIRLSKYKFPIACSVREKFLYFFFVAFSFRKLTDFVCVLMKFSYRFLVVVSFFSVSLDDTCWCGIKLLRGVNHWLEFSVF